MVSNNIVHPSILLSERNAKISAKHVAQKNEVLLCYRLVEPVLSFEVGANLRRDSLVIHQWITRDLVHGNEGGGCDKPDCYNAGEQPFKCVGKHS